MHSLSVPWEKVFPQEGGQALNRLPRAVVVALNMPEFKRCLDATFRHGVWFLGGPVWSQ